MNLNIGPIIQEVWVSKVIDKIIIIVKKIRVFYRYNNQYTIANHQTYTIKLIE